jgi:hypothetical protein
VFGSINGWLTKALKTPDGDWKQAGAHRRIVLAWLFAPGVTAISSKDLTREAVYALEQWIGAWYDEIETEWRANDDFAIECATVLLQALADDVERMGELDGQP